MKNCIFCKIIRGEIPSTVRYEDEKIIAFNDVNPMKDVHVLFIPKEHIEVFEKISDDSIFPSIRKAIQQIITEEELVGKGYKIVANGGGHQEVDHLHFHLIGPQK